MTGYDELSNFIRPEPNEQNLSRTIKSGSLFKKDIINTQKT